jgi:hypothetical protein
MFVVSRKNQESVIVDGFEGQQRSFKVTVLEINGSSVKLGIDVHTEVSAQGNGCGSGLTPPTKSYPLWGGHDFGMN